MFSGSEGLPAVVSVAVSISVSVPRSNLPLSLGLRRSRLRWWGGVLLWRCERAGRRTSLLLTAVILWDDHGRAGGGWVHLLPLLLLSSTTALRPAIRLDGRQRSCLHAL